MTTSTLLDLASRVVAQIYPFQLIEERHKIIPEPVQRNIIFHSFPNHAKDILMYSNYFNNEEHEFKEEGFQCEDVLQVGFLLTGRVREQGQGSGGGGGEQVVRISFDRCKITSIACTCTTNSSLAISSSSSSSNKKGGSSSSSFSSTDKLVFWCDHVVALALYRIKNPEKISLRVPISETLLTLSRPQLQKLLQYLLQDHPSVLPTAQNLADSLLTNKSTINQVHGAPDITAGGSLCDEHSWAFNEQNMADMIKENIYDESKLESIVGGLFKKIQTMTRSSDTNAPRILTLITQTFLQNRPPHRTLLWDQLQTLWEITVMNPSKSIETRELHYSKLLNQFNSHPNIPLDEGNEPLLKRCLTLIKTDYAKKTTPDLKLNCLRLQALSSHGYRKQALTLGHRILKGVKKSDNFELDYDLATVVMKVFTEHSLHQEACEFALLTLGQLRSLPGTLYLQEKWLKSEETFISKIKLGENKGLLEQYCETFLSKNYNNSNSSSSSNPLPLYNFGKFIYKNSQTPVAFKLCIKFLKMPIPTQTFIQSSLEHQQVALTLLLINNCKNSKSSLETILKTLSSCLKSISCLFRIAQESSRLDSMEMANQNLLLFSFNLGLHVLRSTLRYNHRRRWDIVRWVMNCSLTCGFYQVLYLLDNWAEFFTPNEAVGTVASQFLNRGTILRLNLGSMQQQRLGESARGVAIAAMRVDPGSCALNALTIAEQDPVSFETAYQIILDAAKQNNLLNCQQIFTLARYMEQRSFYMRAYELAAIAIGHLHIPFNQETHSLISDIHWSTSLAQSLGDAELSDLLPLIISNIKCASVLSEILKRAAMEPPRKCHRNAASSNKIYTRLKLLVEATINSYITTIHNRLAHISPRHYADFIEYLAKAKECFMFAPDGVVKFREVIMSIKREYKGKKKLLLLLIERFG